MKTVLLAGTFDTKGEECAFVKGLLESRGVKALTVHMGVYPPAFEPDVSNAEVARAAGEEIAEVAARGDRAWATQVLSKGMRILVPQLHSEGRFDGILSFGGSGGTSLIAPAMRALPIGVPKVMVSTMASGNTAQYVGTSDIVMIPSVVDVSGLNSISVRIFSNAVAAVVGMVQHEAPALPEARPLVAATMFGVTTPCVTRAREYLEARGYEVLVFHATGTGGRSMEALVDAGFISGVLDLTTTEWCDELVGGVLAAGPHRCEAAARNHIPQVVSVGAVDMVNFGPPETVPPRFAGRRFYRHNPTVTLMRTTAEENAAVGKKLAEKLNRAEGNTALLLPLRGVSAIDVEGAPFYGPEEDRALFDTLRAEVRRDRVELVELDCAINDPAFAEAAAQKLLELMTRSPAKQP